MDRCPKEKAREGMERVSARERDPQNHTTLSVTHFNKHNTPLIQNGKVGVDPSDRLVPGKKNKKQIS